MDSMRSASATVGSTRYEVGRLAAVTLSMYSGRLAKRFLNSSYCCCWEKNSTSATSGCCVRAARPGLLLGGGVDLHEHLELDAVLPRLRRVVDAGAEQHGPTHEAERHRHRQHRRGGEQQVAAEVAERLLDGVAPLRHQA
jgi:hypothetical protein